MVVARFRSNPASRASDTGSQLTSTMRRASVAVSTATRLPAQAAARRVGDHELRQGAACQRSTGGVDDRRRRSARLTRGVGTRRGGAFDERRAAGLDRRGEAVRRHRRHPPTRRRLRDPRTRRATAATSSSAAAGPDWKNERRADPQTPAGDDLVHHGISADADIRRHAEQLDVAVGDPRRSLARSPHRRAD